MLFLVGQVLAYSTKVQAWLAKRFLGGKALGGLGHSTDAFACSCLRLYHSGQYFLDVDFG